MTPIDLFDGFDANTVASIEQNLRAQQQTTGQATAMRRTSRIQTRRAKAEARLAEILPARFTEGDSWHVLSHGDIDALSYLRHALAGVTHFDHVLIETERQTPGFSPGSSDGGRRAPISRPTCAARAIRR